MTSIRRASQVLSLFTFIYILWSTTYPLKGFLKPDLFFKIDPLLTMMTSLSERLIIPGALASGTMVLLTLLLGRFFCGWICPLGCVIDMAGSGTRKRAEINDVVNKKIRRYKFYILGLITLFAIWGKQIAWFFDPTVIMGRFVSINLIPFATSIFDSAFIFLIKIFRAVPELKDAYHFLKPTILGVKAYFFSNAGIIFIYFLFAVLGALFMRRLWCRTICPLGALYSIIGRFSPLKRVVKGCIECGMCKSKCRMGAIKDDMSYVQGECVLCMDCIYDCPSHATAFRFFAPPLREKGIKKEDDKTGISRRDFLVFLSLPLVLSAFRFRVAKRMRSGIIRPPAALEEGDFLNRCIRCGNCMKVCITNGLQPVIFKAGFEGVWTPELVPEIGYCEYRCTLCGNTCPTGAIQPLTLEKKMKTKLGTAVITQSICIPWAEGKECIVCEEHCPVPDKAIKLISEGGISKPYVDKALCVGCGICQNKCPVRPIRAIRVSPI